MPPSDRLDTVELNHPDKGKIVVNARDAKAFIEEQKCELVEEAPKKKKPRGEQSETA